VETEGKIKHTKMRCALEAGYLVSSLFQRNFINCPGYNPRSVSTQLNCKDLKIIDTDYYFVNFVLRIKPIPVTGCGGP
jgi:hypothetical protein